MKKSQPEIIYYDDDIIVVNKPANISVIPDRSDDPQPSLKEWLSEKYNQVYIVHRLDKATSGLVIFARTAESHKSLNRQFEERSVRKEYYAIIDGLPLESPAEIEIPLVSHPTKNLVFTDPSGKPSSTLIKVEESFKRTSLLRVRLNTGRKHQIRVHLAYIGNPLLVDPFYGKREAFFLSEIKKKYKTSKEESPLIDRLSLHATFLQINHPKTDVKMEWNIPLPNDMQVVLKQLRKWDN